ncbi:MAG: hypothetical protein J4431_02875 [Candidatus Aenigmarchaeota archaeon]|nr:hypothetical protein [Candidatus Aenigmarchaeota archaeon]
MTLKPQALGIASSATVAVVDVAGYIWHGLMGQPSVMDILYPGFWTSPLMLALGLAGSVAAAYGLGYFFALAYNMQEKR